MVAFLSLSACEGVHLYNEKKNTTATAIRNKKSEINIEKLSPQRRSGLPDLLGIDMSPWRPSRWN